MKILLAEDEVQLSNVFKAAITHQGYDVDTAYNGQEAVDLAAKNPYDVIIMDIMMPIKTGLEALREIRSTGNQTHVIMLTAMAEIDDRVTGLDAGADDYLTKPISLKELLARLRSLERRVEVTFTQNLLQKGNITLNVSEQELSADNSVRLAGKETKLLSFFILNQGKQLSTADIFKHVWAGDTESDERLVYIYVSYLRQKLQAVQADVWIEGEEDGDFALVACQKEE
ncbi:response regulator transcription factor [Streptococcus saliviloxodontae]|uniref:DNA-binding response OmpR family regulator n=1 Tax=Streptococcus saliviloxodontae TaxID=1349416 RepID=A0ABS2PN74_9STRE|nr:response regulator transcription factor [Streptococcus saliviloxodontae]MBM7636809.1 DNA-binding response OmpR family regulator [Streptococcus saliviloxodontae]